MTAMKSRLQGMNADTFRFTSIPMRFLDLLNHARIHTFAAPFTRCRPGKTRNVGGWRRSDSRRHRAKNKNSTPAHSPEVLSAARAVCCDLIHGQDSNWSGPWASRHGATGYARIIVTRNRY